MFAGANGPGARRGAGAASVRGAGAAGGVFRHLARGGADAVEGVEEAAEAEGRLGVLACSVLAEERINVLDHHNRVLGQVLRGRAK